MNTNDFLARYGELTPPREMAILKKLFWWMILLLLMATLVTAAPNATSSSPQDQFLQIYFLLQEADDLEKAGQKNNAAVRYREVKQRLEAFKKTNPDWEPVVINFRLKYVTKKIASMGDLQKPEDAQSSKPTKTSITNYSQNPLIVEKLRTIIIPTCIFENASITDVATFLTAKSKELDTKDHRGVQIIISSESLKAPSSNEITLKLSNQSLERVLDFIALSGVKIQVEEGTIEGTVSNLQKR